MLAGLSGLSGLSGLAGGASLINVALSSLGAVATGSSQFNANFPASAANNGARTGAWGSPSGGWADQTSNTYPDTLEINFGQSRTVSRAVVVTLADSGGAVEPTAATLATVNGLTDFQIQYWNGSTWVTVATVTANDKAMRDLSFSAVTTDRMRLYVTAARANFSRVMELEFWGF
jgi:hypothetical protein